MATTVTSATNGSGSGIIQSLGIGSGLDVNSLVTQLVNAERSAQDSRITRQAQQVSTDISSLGQLKGAVSTFQSAVSGLAGTSNFQLMSATSADTTVFSASATSKAVAGTYTVSVQQLAQPEQVLSKNFTGGAQAVVGTGTLSLTVGTSSFSVDIKAGANTLADVRDAINDSSTNTGVRAALVYGVNGAQLALTSSNTGAANTLKVAASGGDGGLAQLAYTGSGDANYTEAQKAQDAIVLVSGVESHSSSNAVSTAIDGVTLNLAAAKKDTPLTLTVSSNQSGVTGNIQRLVAAYNTMQGVFAQLGSYDAASKTAGPMLGDALLSGTSDQLRRGMTDPVAGVASARSSLAAIGITTSADGTLAVDSTKLQAALTADGNGVAQLFGGPNGIATRLGASLDKMLASNGSFAARDTSLTASQKDITDQQATLDAQMALVQQRYLAQFNALDSLMSQMSSTASYLTTQLNSNLQLANYNTTKTG